MDGDVDFLVKFITFLGNFLGFSVKLLSCNLFAPLPKDDK